MIFYYYMVAFYYFYLVAYYCFPGVCESTSWKPLVYEHETVTKETELSN